jgi:oligosaccharide repeat unit polymerase
MLASTFNILILLIGLFWFLYLAYQQRTNKYFLITPFLLFGFQEIISIWGIPLNYSFKGKSLDGWEILVIGTAFLAFVVGFFLAGGKKLPINSYLSQPITAKHSPQYYFMSVSISSLFLIALGTYYYQGVPAMGALALQLFLGNIDLNELGLLMAEQRYLLTKSHWFGGEYRGQGVITAIQKIGWRFVFAVSLIMFLQLKSKKWLFLCISTGLLLIWFQAGTGERSPLAFSFLFILIVLSLIQKINVKHVIILTALGFAFLMVTTYFSAKGSLLKDSPDMVSKLSQQLVERIFLGNAIHDLEVIDFMESGRLEKRYGMWHVEKFLTSFPGVRVGVPLGFHISYLRGSSEDTFSSGTYMGLVYADFGYSGILFGFLTIGAFLAFAQKQIFNKERDIIVIVLSSMVIFYLSWMAGYGFIGFSSDMVMVVFFWGTFHFFGSFFSKTQTTKLSISNSRVKSPYPDSGHEKRKPLISDS